MIRRKIFFLACHKEVPQYLKKKENMYMYKYLDNFSLRESLFSLFKQTKEREI